MPAKVEIELWFSPEAGFQKSVYLHHFKKSLLRLFFLKVGALSNFFPVRGSDLGEYCILLSLCCFLFNVLIRIFHE